MASKIIIYTDGGSRNNPGLSGIGVVIVDENGKVLKEISKPLGIRTNNWAEYEAVIEGVQAVKRIFGKEQLQTKDIEVRADSELIIKQLRGEYKIKEETLFPQFIKMWNMRVSDFPNIVFTHIPREKNKAADALANKAMDAQMQNKREKNAGQTQNAKLNF